MWNGVEDDTAANERHSSSWRVHWSRSRYMRLRKFTSEKDLRFKFGSDNNHNTL